MKALFFKSTDVFNEFENFCQKILNGIETHQFDIACMESDTYNLHTSNDARACKYIWLILQAQERDETLHPFPESIEGGIQFKVQKEKGRLQEEFGN